MVVGTVLGAAEEVVRTKNRETKPVVGAVVVVAVGPGRAAVADEEKGAGETGGMYTAAPWWGNFCGGGGRCSTESFGCRGVDGTAWLRKERVT